MPRAAAFPQPIAGDIVLCRFPVDLRKPQPGPKPRPAIVLRVLDAAAAEPGIYRVQVCYATSNRARLYPHEFEIAAADHAEAYRRSGLSADTKFDMSQMIVLPFTDEWFQVPAVPMYGKTPKLGELHATMMSKMTAAYAAGRRR